MYIAYNCLTENLSFRTRSYNCNLTIKITFCYTVWEMVSFCLFSPPNTMLQLIIIIYLLLLNFRVLGRRFKNINGMSSIRRFAL